MSRHPIPCVACILENKEGKILVGKRIADGLIGFPGKNLNI
jgi:8-oxo-dGTP pyrophosphatase MutT (NUDIX family)